MALQYPQEVRDQQAKVKRELEKLARMRTEHLIATGQMPPSRAKSKPAPGTADRVASAPNLGHPEARVS